MIFVYCIPALMAVECRVEFGLFSFELAELGVPIVWLVAGLRHMRGRKSYLTLNEITLIYIMLLMALLSIVIGPDTRHAMSVYRDFSLPLLFLAGLLSLGLKREELLLLVKIFILCAALTAGLGIAQAMTGDFMWSLRFEDAYWQERKTDLIAATVIGALLGIEGTLPVGLQSTTPNFAEYLVIPAVVALALSLTAGTGKKERLLWLVTFFIIWMCLIYTFSRGTNLTLLIILLIFAALYRKSRFSMPTLIGVGALGLAAAYWVISSGIISWDRLGTLKGRGEMIGAALDLIGDHPFGVFWGGYTDVYLSRYYSGQQVHNIFLYLILQFGYITTLAWMSLVLLVLRRMSKLVSSHDRAKTLGIALLAGLGATVFIYAQTTVFLGPVTTSLRLHFWLAVALSLFYNYKRNLAILAIANG